MQRAALIKFLCTCISPSYIMSFYVNKASGTAEYFGCYASDIPPLNSHMATESISNIITIAEYLATSLPLYVSYCSLHHGH